MTVNVFNLRYWQLNTFERYHVVFLYANSDFVPDRHVLLIRLIDLRLVHNQTEQYNQATLLKLPYLTFQ